MNLIAARLRLLVARARYTITKIRSLPLQYQLAVGQYMDIPADPASLAKHVAALSPEKRKAAEQWLAEQDPELLPGLPDRMEGYLLRWAGHAPAKLVPDAVGTGTGTTSMPTLNHQDGPPLAGPFGSTDQGRTGEIVLLRTWVKGHVEDFLTTWDADWEGNWIRDVEQGFTEWPPATTEKGESALLSREDRAQIIQDFFFAMENKLKELLSNPVGNATAYVVAPYVSRNVVVIYITKDLPPNRSFAIPTPPEVVKVLDAAWKRFVAVLRVSFPEPWVVKASVRDANGMLLHRVAMTFPPSLRFEDHLESLEHYWKSNLPAFTRACAALERSLFEAAMLHYGGTKDDWKIADFVCRNYDTGEASLYLESKDVFQVPEDSLLVEFEPYASDAYPDHPAIVQALADLRAAVEPLFAGTHHKLIAEKDVNPASLNVLLLVDHTPGENVNWERFRFRVQDYMRTCEEVSDQNGWENDDEDGQGGEDFDGLSSEDD